MTPSRYRAFLFDMDGTIISSIAAAERVWRRWATEKNLDIDAFMLTIHGARAIDTVTRAGIPGVDPVSEAAKITQWEIDDLEGIVEIGGARDFLASLPPDQWAIVTSAPLELARHRLQAAGMPTPAVFVSGDDVTVGKPDPSGYRLAMARLGVTPEQTLVFEDAPIGIAAGEASGADVMVITQTHAHPITTAHAVTKNYETLSAHRADDGYITIATAP
jgi:sugar-phosphatase